MSKLNNKRKKVVAYGGAGGLTRRVGCGEHFIVIGTGVLSGFHSKLNVL